VIAALVLAPATTVIVSPAIAAVVFGGLIWLTIAYIRAVRRAAGYREH
jgi:hypothetical protein